VALESVEKWVAKIVLEGVIVISDVVHLVVLGRFGQFPSRALLDEQGCRRLRDPDGHVQHMFVCLGHVEDDPGEGRPGTRAQDPEVAGG